MTERPPTEAGLKRFFGEPFSGRARHDDPRIDTRNKARAARNRYYSRSNDVVAMVEFGPDDVPMLSDFETAGFTDPIGVRNRNDTVNVRFRHRADPNRIAARQVEIDDAGRHEAQQRFINEGEDFDFTLAVVTGIGSGPGDEMTKAQNYQIKWALELNDLELLPDPPPAHPEVGGRARQAAKTIKAALGG